MVRCPRWRHQNVKADHGPIEYRNIVLTLARWGMSPCAIRHAQMIGIRTHSALALIELPDDVPETTQLFHAKDEA